MIKFKRLFLALSVLSLCLASLSSVEVHAEHVHATEYVADESGEAQPKARVCTYCSSRMNESTYTSTWKFTGKTLCIHHNFDYDYHYSRSVIKTYTCSGCSHSFDITSTETKTECHGYDPLS